MENALLGASEERVWGISKLPDFDLPCLQQHMSRINAIPRTSLPMVIAGDLSMTQFAKCSYITLSTLPKLSFWIA